MRAVKIVELSGSTSGPSVRPAATGAPSLVAVILICGLQAGAVMAGDLSVGWISRHPEMPYVWESSDPTREGWPVPGETVTWRAHVRSWHNRSRVAVFRWRLDGKIVDTGWFRIAPGETVEVDFAWTWTFDRHELTFEISPSMSSSEESIRNNSLTVFTDALAVGLWVEQSFFDMARRKMLAFDMGAVCFEDWMQLVIKAFNDAAAIALYPETPEGVFDRYRLQKIVLAPDGSLPLRPVPPEIGDPIFADAFDGRFPDIDDRTVDMQWGFPARTAPWHEDDGLGEFLQSALIHEIGHARYLVDVYGWWVYLDRPHHNIEISPLPPRDVMGYLHHASSPGLMHQQWSWIDRYSAAALNRIAGHRATEGHYNGPANFGEFLNDLPTENRVRIVDAEGEPVRHAPVRIFQASRSTDPSQFYAADYDGSPDLVLTTDGDGWIDVGRNPFSSDGPVIHEVEYSNATAIVQVEHGDRTHTGYLESLWFNLAFWRGETDAAEHVLQVGGRVCSPIWRPWPLSPILETVVTSSEVTLEWQPIDEAEGYQVWVSEDLAAPRMVGETTASSLATTLRGDVQWWVEAVLAGCPNTRSRMGRFSLVSDHPPRRRAAHRTNPR